MNPQQKSKLPVNTHKQKTAAKTTAQARAQAAATRKNVMDKLDEWVSVRLRFFFVVSLILTVVFGALLFDAKISTGGDDSHYIEMADNFLKGRSFPTWHGPLYPLFLSLPIWLIGVHVIWLKLFSFVFVILHLVFFYLAFRKQISPFLLAMTLLIISVNSSVLYFASQTYSEALFMFLQSFLIFLFIKGYLVMVSGRPFSLKGEAFQWLAVGFFVFLASLTRNIGIMALFAMAAILILQKRFRSLLMLIAGYLVFLFPFRFYKAIAWQTSLAKGSRPFHEILLKNFYNPAEGHEDFGGMVIRFFENARLYFSKHLMIGIGMHDPASTSKNYLVTLIIVFLILLAFFQAYRKSRTMLFVSAYLIAAISATFLALQQSWDQMRMVIIYLPLMVLLMSWGLIETAKIKRYSFLNVLVPLLLVFILLKTFGQTIEKAQLNNKVLTKNLSGNRYYGYTPDWQNFLRLSEWVGKNLPDTALVASRKPSMSFIYSGGRDFYAMYRFPQQEPLSFMNSLKQRVGELIVIPNAQFESTVPAPIQLELKRSAIGFVAEGNDIYGLYRGTEPERSAILQATESFGLPVLTTDSLMRRVKNSSQSCFAVSPDTLMNTLRKNGVDYALIASLRANPNQNTGNIINTMQRYFYFIERKYPGILTLVQQVGDQDNEPAWLYQINYTYFGL